MSSPIQSALSEFAAACLLTYFVRVGNKKRHKREAVAGDEDGDAVEIVVTLLGGTSSQTQESSGGEGRARGRAEEPEVCAETEEVMTASLHLDLGLLLLLLACWQPPGMVGASESLCSLVPLSHSASLCF